MLKPSELSWLACFIVSFSIPRNATGDVGNAMTTEIRASDETAAGWRLWIYGATIGEDWFGFPVFRFHDYNTLPFQYQNNVWLTGVAKSDQLGGQWQPFATPELLRHEFWIEEMPSRLLGMELFAGRGAFCCWYKYCPADFLDPPVYDPSVPGSHQGCDPFDCCPGGYCPGAYIWDDSRFPLDLNGQITLTDWYGGTASSEWGELVYSGPLRAPGEDVATNTEIRVVFAIHRPGLFFQPGVGLFDGPPGVAVPFEYSRRFNGVDVVARPSVLLVHHASADVPWTSPGVDAADLASIVTGLGHCAGYGLQSEVGLDCRAWYLDTNADGNIDAGDVAVWAAESNQPDCQLSKASDGPGVEAILAWFGMSFTDNFLDLQGMEIREVVVVDEAQMHRAVLDPYGYLRPDALRTLPAMPESWSNIKQLYRD